MAEAPSPFGWCARCLVDDDDEEPAVTMWNGYALCRGCAGSGQRWDPEAKRRL